MTKATKPEKTSGSDMNKESIVIQKGTSRSGRAIKPKTIFGETIIEIAKQTKNYEKGDSLKASSKVVKKVLKPAAKKSVAVKKEVTEQTNKVTPKMSPIPEGFTPVDITAIISAKQQNDVKAKSVVAKVVAVSPANKVNNVPKTIVLTRSPVPQKQMTYEEREKEIQMLRARLKKLEAEQEAERKIRANKTNDVKKVPEKVVKKTVVKPKTVAEKKVVTAVTDDRPARVKKPTWKAMEQE